MPRAAATQPAWPGGSDAGEDHVEATSPSIRTIKSIRGEAEAIVAACDIDQKDGLISLVELIAALREKPKLLVAVGLGPDATADDIFMLFRSIDTDGTGKLDHNELLDFLVELQGTSLIQKSARKASQIDKAPSLDVKVDSGTVPLAFQDTVDFDVERRRLLDIGRSTSPIDSVFTFSAIGYTIIPRIITQPLTIITFTLYGVIAYLVRSGKWAEWEPSIGEDYENVDNSVFSGATILVPFMICFYVGYCYKRFYELYFACMTCEGEIFDCCQLAKSYLADPEDVVMLWRYLNLIHVAGYTGLGSTYNKDNLFNDFCDIYDLIPDPTERRIIERLNVEQGGRVYRLVIVWLLHHVATSKVMVNPDDSGQNFFVNGANYHILTLRKAIKKLYDYQFQVLPYVYTHMIGTATTMFLIAHAIEKAFYFTPKAPISYGFVFPLFGLVFIVFSCVGLIDIGSTLCNPFGGDAEDFAVFHFLNFTATSSRHMIDTHGKPSGSWGLESPTFRGSMEALGIDPEVPLSEGQVRKRWGKVKTAVTARRVYGSGDKTNGSAETAGNAETAKPKPRVSFGIRSFSSPNFRS